MGHGGQVYAGEFPVFLRYLPYDVGGLGVKLVEVDVVKLLGYRPASVMPQGLIDLRDDRPVLPRPNRLLQQRTSVQTKHPRMAEIGQLNDLHRSDDTAGFMGERNQRVGYTQGTVWHHSTSTFHLRDNDSNAIILQIMTNCKWLLSRK